MAVAEAHQALGADPFDGQGPGEPAQLGPPGGPGVQRPGQGGVDVEVPAGQEPLLVEDAHQAGDRGQVELPVRIEAGHDELADRAGPVQQREEFPLGGGEAQEDQGVALGDHHVGLAVAGRERLHLHRRIQPGTPSQRIHPLGQSLPEPLAGVGRRFRRHRRPGSRRRGPRSSGHR